MKRLLLIASLALLAGPALAIPIVGVNDPTNNRAEWTEVDDTIFIINESAYGGTITSFGFDAENDSVGSVTVTGTRDNGGWSFQTSRTVNGAGGGSFEYGVTTANSGNLTGGSPNRGIAPGDIGSFTFDGSLGAVSNHFVRFQRTGPGGGGSDRGNACYDCPPVMTVPEPSSVLLLGIGLLGVGAAAGVRRTTARC